MNAERSRFGNLYYDRYHAKNFLIATIPTPTTAIPIIALNPKFYKKPI